VAAVTAVFQNKETYVKIELLPVFLLASLLSAPPSLAQTAHPVATGKNPQIGTDLHTPAEALPQPTETELLKIENLQLKATVLAQALQSIDEQLKRLPSERDATRKQQDQILQDYTALIKKIESEHPGFHWEPVKRTLIAIPKPTDKAPAPAKEVPAK
jgi:hypothetical protein